MKKGQDLICIKEIYGITKYNSYHIIDVFDNAISILNDKKTLSLFYLYPNYLYQKTFIYSDYFITIREQNLKTLNEEW